MFLEVLDKRHVFEFKLEQRSHVQYFIYLKMSVGFRKYLQTALMFSDFLFSLRGVQSIKHVRLTSMSVLERGEGRGVATKKKNSAQITLLAKKFRRFYFEHLIFGHFQSHFG